MAKYKIIPSSRTIVQSPISIGHKAEKGVEAIEFDLTAWVETYGSGTLTVIMRRWGDVIPYPIALEIDENNKATWTLSDIDTAKAGMAYAQLSYVVGETVVKKSDIYTFRVMDSLTGEGEPPEAYESWLEHLTHLAAEAMAEVLDIEGIVTDKTLTVDGGIADAKATGDALSALEDQFSEETDQLKADLDDLDDRVTALEGSGGGGSGLTVDIKEALLACFHHVKFMDDDNDYCQDLYDALYPTVTTRTVSYSLSHVTSSNNVTTVTSGASYTATLTASSGYTINTVTVTMGGADVTSTVYSSGTITIPSVTGNIVITATAVASVSGISAVYTQSGTVYTNTNLNSLKSDLVVTATYTGGTTGTIPGTDYTLSGSLTEGTSTITVSYGGKSTTFTVTVTEAPITYLYNWDFTQSLVDSVSSSEVTLGADSGTANPTRDSSGLSFNAATQFAYFGQISPVGKTFEIDVASLDFKGNTNYHIRFFTNAQYTTSTAKGITAICWKSGEGWSSYGWQTGTSTTAVWSSDFWSSDLTGTSSNVINAFNGKTVKVVFHSDGHTKDLYLDNVYKGTIDDVYFNNSGTTHYSDKIYIAGMGSKAQGKGDQCYDMTITGVRIYQNEAEEDSE